MKVEVSYSFDVPEELVQEVIQKAAEKEVSKRTWIPVTERLPELTEQAEGDDFLVYHSKDVVTLSGRSHGPQIGRYTREGRREKWADETFDEITYVTHWMPLPDPPEEH